MSEFLNTESSSKDSLDENPEIENTEHPLTEIVRFSIFAILIVIPIRMFIAQPFIVSGASMDDTFHSGEYLIVDQLSYHFDQPTRGEVIIFRYPRDPSKFFIKRVIGLPGETITIENAKVTITNDENPDGFTLEEPYIKSMEPAAPMSETLGEREYFVMGDNRDQSSDSRSWGVLQEERIVGRAFLRLFPPSEVDYLPGATEVQTQAIE
ncbi:signal peptidase I [Candidatus Kaiserbacteria bacterium]|nr:signal peptidase I [Candidatus Kaiserbacteria bacterium]